MSKIKLLNVGIIFLLFSNKPLQPSTLFLGRTNMAADVRIQSIAQTAISQINNLVSPVEHRGTVATDEDVSLME